MRQAGPPAPLVLTALTDTSGSQSRLFTPRSAIRQGLCSHSLAGLRHGKGYVAKPMGTAIRQGCMGMKALFDPLREVTWFFSGDSYAAGVEEPLFSTFWGPQDGSVYVAAPARFWALNKIGVASPIFDSPLPMRGPDAAGVAHFTPSGVLAAPNRLASQK